LSRAQAGGLVSFTNDYQIEQFDTPHQQKSIPEYESEVAKPQENMKLNTLSMSMRSQTRTSKTILNENA
jgi:hypothetical protein